MKRIVPLLLVGVLVFGVLGRADEQTPAPNAFPAEPPAGIAGNTIQDGMGTSVKMLVWGKEDKFFWYFEPVPGSAADFCLYPGDVMVTQNGTLFQHVEFLDKNGNPFAGPVKEPRLLRFTACGWEESGIRCVKYGEPFEVFLPPSVYMTIQKGAAAKINILHAK